MARDNGMKCNDDGRSAIGIPIRLWVVLAVAVCIRLWARIPLDSRYQPPRQLNVLLAPEETSRGDIDEAVFRSDMMRSKPVTGGQYVGLHALFPTAPVTSDYEGLHKLAPRPVDDRYELSDVLNGGLAFSPAHISGNATPLYLVRIARVLAKLDTTPIGSWARLVLELGLDGLTSYLIYRLIESLSDARNPGSCGLSLSYKTGLLTALALNPIQIVLFWSGSLHSLHLLGPLLAVGGTYWSTLDGSAFSSFAWYMSSFVGRLMCFYHQPGYHMTVEFAVLLVKPSMDQGRPKDEQKKRSATLIDLSTLLVWVFECLVLHGLAFFLLIYLFVSPIHPDVLAVCKNTLSIIRHLVSSYILDKIRLKSSLEINLSPTWLAMHLLMPSALAYYSIMTLLIPIAFVSLLLTLRVGLSAIRGDSVRGQFLLLKTSLILVSIYHLLMPRFHADALVQCMTLLFAVMYLPIKKSHDDSEESKDLDHTLTFHVTMFVAFTGFLWVANETERWVVDYTSNSNIIFSGNLVCIAGPTLLLIKSLSTLINDAFENNDGTDEGDEDEQSEEEGQDVQDNVSHQKDKGGITNVIPFCSKDTLKQRREVVN